ncbi:MAG: glycoside hydrolase family 24 [Rhodospirillaceae bacterium BRH_c57]|nr:MAG: glycoside hydrolase family 24 [Rhodospirillaceae bacterium BRH_c57]
MSPLRTTLAVLTLSAAGLAGIVGWEGYSGTAYRDVAGVPTIGYGTTEGVKMGDTITKPEAMARAKTDVQAFEGALRRCVKVPLHQHEYDALVSISYNIGPGAFCRSTLVRKLNAGDYVGACAEILRWNRAGGRVVQGLVNRRKAEYRLCIGSAP